MTTVLKLGGSLITQKDKEATVDHAQLERVCEMIGESEPGELVVLHGGGSFGHVEANRAGITTENGSSDPHALRRVMVAMNQLHDIVMDGLLAVDVPAISVPPRAMAHKRSDGSVDIAPGPTATLLEEGFVPVLHGDVIAHPGRGASVVSADTLAVKLGEALESDRVGLCAGVSGVLRQGDVIPEIESYDAVADVFETTQGIDVSGGMAGKVEALLGTSCTGCIFGITDLPGFLAGNCPGTTVLGETRTDDTDPF